MSRLSIHQVLAPAAAAAIVLLLAAAPASARQDAGALTTSSTGQSSSTCSTVEPGSLTATDEHAGASGVLLKFRRHGM